MVEVLFENVYNILGNPRSKFPKTVQNYNYILGKVFSPLLMGRGYKKNPYVITLLDNKINVKWNCNEIRTIKMFSFQAKNGGFKRMNLSRSTNEIIEIAARRAQLPVFELWPVHLLLGCSLLEKSIAYKLLQEEGITEKRILENKSVPFPEQTFVDVMKVADEAKNLFDQPEIYSEILLFALVTRCSQSMSVLEKIKKGACGRIADKVAESQGIKPNSDKFKEIKIVSFDTTDPKLTAKNGGFGDFDGGNSSQGLPKEMLSYGADLTARARQGKIDEIVGREEESNRLVEILCRKTKNNPCLIGEAGVGKSAIVEGLAKKIAAGDVPEILQDKIVFSLDIGTLMAGTKFRGELEGRVTQILDTLGNRNDIILFIDEIHNIVTATGKEGEMGIAEILKPKLARGELRCVGATTLDEYRKYIEKDAALERRFAPIMVYPPNMEQAIQILNGLKDSFEKFHKIEIEPAAIVAAVSMADRYINDRNLPDKAIDVLDEACSKNKIRHINKVNVENIAEVISSVTKIPLSKITAKEIENLNSLEGELKEKIIGQDAAVDAIVRAVKRSRSGISDRDKPTGSFIFLGRTGVGKTEVCKVLAKQLFDTDRAFIKLDMSEFAEAHSVSKLIGSPAGYVGYEDESVLCDKVRRNPYCLVLFDEIEKAHPDIYNVLLQVLDEGKLTNGHGRAVSFKNAIIVMTSNVGVKDIIHKNAIGFGSENLEEQMGEEEIILNGMKKRFPPEFINRIDNVIVFNSLKKEDVMKIARIHLENLKKKLSSVGVEFIYSDKVVKQLAEKGYDREYGIRPLKRVIQKEIEDKVSEAIIMENITRYECNFLG
ncbi:MAG: ATP-dependent Clp protease ATP-binding subunit [Christensenellaceae bacterium]|jgi:ATP-dependent Clp protease ATP-binding subunit ClpC|nr:ATP-dependent Clp protease ATP-binding subunit [Christensenellaceae bacterium]